ncbi:MAG: thiamine diphosphokinase [Flavobacteriaceae bacterium]|nr:thiamine diphosphokinase [Flavobacteriaceae bacterium]
MTNNYNKAIIVADGERYKSIENIDFSDQKTIVIFCDGAYNTYINIKPNIVIGDMDSIKLEDESCFINTNISYDLNLVFAKNIDNIVTQSDLTSIYDNIKQGGTSFLYSEDQNTNDLTKAMLFCAQIGIKKIDIIGVNGKREDHFLANFSMMFQYAQLFSINAISNWGSFISIKEKTNFDSFAGQNVSVFTLEAEITTKGLKYPLDKKKINFLHQGTLNQSLVKEFSIDPHGEVALVYRSL